MTGNLPRATRPLTDQHKALLKLLAARCVEDFLRDLQDVLKDEHYQKGLDDRIVLDSKASR